MQDAIGQLRSVIAHPTGKGLVAAVAAIWSAVVGAAPDAYLVSAGLVALLFGLDGVLGVWQAYQAGEFSKRGLTRFVSKGLAYGGLIMLAFTVGLAGDIVRGGINLAAAYAAAVAANVMIVATEGLSIAGHIDTLSDGKLGAVIGPLRGLLEQMRAAKQA